MQVCLYINLPKQKYRHITFYFIFDSISANFTKHGMILALSNIIFINYPMNSSQLLNSLNKQSHKNHNKTTQPAKSLQPVVEHPKKGGTLHSVIHKQNQFSQIKHLPSQLVTAPQFLLELLKQQVQQNICSKQIQQTVKQECKQRERNVYVMFNNSHLAYLEELKILAAHKNQFASQSINDVMMKRFNFVTGDLQHGRLIINRDRAITTKNQVEQCVDLDRARLIKIKEGSIRSKIDLLNNKMVQMEKIQKGSNNSQSIEALNKKIEENLDLASYGLESEKTKIAKDYIKYMSEQRREQRKRQKLREQRKSKVEQQRQAQLKQAQQMRDLSKKQQILQRIQQKRKKREQQQKQIAEKQEGIDKFLEKYRQQMPIFKKKVKQFEEKYVKPEKAYRQEKLKQIKQKKKSYSLNDIVDHEKKYEQIRRKQNQRKSSEKQMYLKSLKINTKEHYKGSAHQIVQQIDRQNREKDIALFQLGKNKKQRMFDYAKQINKEHKPKVDQNKRTQLLKLLQREEMKNNKMTKKYRPVVNSDGEDVGVESFYEEKKQKNRYREGNRFMEQGNLNIKKNISQSVDATSVVPSQTEEDQSLKLLKKTEGVRQKVVTQKDIWKLRSKQLAEMSNNYNSPKQFQQVKVNFENLDKRAADKQRLMKHSKLNVDEYIEQKGALDQFYLESIKQKMKLLQ